MNEPDDYIVIGRVTGAYGIKGWIKVHPFTRERDGIKAYPKWYVGHDRNWKAYTVITVRPQGKGMAAQLEGVDGRNQAEALRSADIAIHREMLPELESNEYYWRDLEGLRVFTVDEIDLGLVDHLIETGANDVLVVRGDKERLIPFLQGEVIRQIDLEKGQIVVDWDPDF